MAPGAEAALGAAGPEIIVSLMVAGVAIDLTHCISDKDPAACLGSALNGVGLGAHFLKGVEGAIGALGKGLDINFNVGGLLSDLTSGVKSLWCGIRHFGSTPWW